MDIRKRQPNGICNVTLIAEYRSGQNEVKLAAKYNVSPKIIVRRLWSENCVLRQSARNIAGVMGLTQHAKHADTIVMQEYWNRTNNGRPVPTEKSVSTARKPK